MLLFMLSLLFVAVRCLLFLGGVGGVGVDLLSDQYELDAVHQQRSASVYTAVLSHD